MIVAFAFTMFMVFVFFTMIMMAIMSVVVVIIGDTRRRFGRLSNHLADHCTASATDTGPQYGPGAATDFLANCRACSAARSAANDRTRLAFAFGGDCSTYATADCAADDGAGLPAYRLTDHGTGRCADTAAYGRFGIAVSRESLCTQQQAQNK